MFTYAKLKKTFRRDLVLFPLVLVALTSGTLNLVMNSFKTVLRISTREEKLQNRLQKARSAYVKERTKQQGLFEKEHADLNKLLKGGSIDEETRARLEQVLNIGYDRKRDETRGKYGFTNHSSQVN